MSAAPRRAGDDQFAERRQTPQVPPRFAQCAQDEQFLQALHGLDPVQVAAWTNSWPKA